MQISDTFVDPAGRKIASMPFILICEMCQTEQ